MNILKQKSKMGQKLYFNFGLVVVLMGLVCLMGCEKKPTDEKVEEVKNGKLTINGLSPESILSSEVVGFKVEIYPSGTTIRLTSYNPPSSGYAPSRYPVAVGNSTSNVFDLYKMKENEFTPTSEKWNETGSDFVVLLTNTRFCGSRLNYRVATITTTVTNGIGEVNYSSFTNLPVTP